MLVSLKLLGEGGEHRSKHVTRPGPESEHEEFTQTHWVDRVPWLHLDLTVAGKSHQAC